MTTHTGTQTITRNILPDTSRSRENQTMKFRQLIKYNKRNIFFEKYCAKWGGETSPTPFLKRNQN